METFVQVCGMTEAVFALVIMAVIGIASMFIKKRDVENMDNPVTPESK